MRSIQLLSLTAAFAVAGCQKAQTGDPVAADAVPKVIGNAFQAADSTIKAEAASAATATSNQDGAALSALTMMLQRTDLTPDQRMALGRCLPAALTATRAAALRGDTKAADALKAYNASK